MKLQAADFVSRKELEAKLATITELSPVKKTHTVEGTERDLKRLNLSSRSTFHGCACVVTSGKQKEVVARQKVDRGIKQDFSINGKVTKVK